MKSFLVLSDTHGFERKKIEELIPAINSCDAVIHLGDGFTDLLHYQDKITAKIYCVQGNCDITKAQTDLILNTEVGNILFTHGHTHGVKSDLLNLSLFALQNNCAYAFYGHTHSLDEDYFNGVTMINPGSFHRPKTLTPSYAVAFIDGKKLITKIISF